MNDPVRLRRASHRLRLALSAVLAFVPTANALVWLFINDLPAANQDILPPYAQLPLPAQARLSGFLVSLIPTGFVMYGILALIRLFRLYETGEFFRAANVRCFRDISRALLGWFTANVASGPLMSLALTLHLPKGQRMVSLRFGTPDLTALLVGLVLAVIAWVMEEGRKLQEEQDYTV